MDIKQEPQDDTPCFEEQNFIQGSANEYATSNIDFSEYSHVKREYDDFESTGQYKVKSEVDSDDDDEIEEFNPRLTVKTEEEEEDFSYTNHESWAKNDSTQDGCSKIEGETDYSGYCQTYPNDVGSNVENDTRRLQFQQIEIQYEPDVEKEIKNEIEQDQTASSDLICNIDNGESLNNDVSSNNVGQQNNMIKTVPNEMIPGCSQNIYIPVSLDVKELDNNVVNNDLNADKGKMFKCNLCNYQCKSIGILNKHAYVHSDEKPFKCDMCSYICKRLGRLKQHKLIHSAEKPFQCDVCDYRSNQSSHLKSHKLTHTDIKPFVCDICQFKCRQMCNLQTHKLVHTSEKLYKCDMCSYDCRLLASLKSHKIIHTNEKSYKCDLCDNEYKRLRNLKIHKTIHSGENMLKCDQCDFTCRLLRNLKSHRKTHKTDKK